MAGSSATNCRYTHEKTPLLPTTTNYEETRRRARAESRNSKVTMILAMSLLVAGVFIAKFRDNKRYQSNAEATSLPSTPQNDSSLSATAELTPWSHSPEVERKETILPGIDPVSYLRGKTDMQLRWGVLGLGRIARDFTSTLIMSGANVTAVAAGSLPNAKARAKAFAEIYSVPQFYGSYEELAADPNVDIVYIATINTLHYDTTILMLRAGKNVLVEKPMAMDYEEAQTMAQEARKANRLLLTNYWTRFFPVIKHVRSVLANQQIGPIYAMRGDFGFPTPLNASDRFLNRLNGGGALLDLGCYLVNLAVMVNPTKTLPTAIEASAQKTYSGVDYGVDTEASFILQWDSIETKGAENEVGKIDANLVNSTMIMTGQASFRRPSSFEVEINGGQGRLVIQGPANSPTEYTIYEYVPYGPLKSMEIVRSELPVFDESFGPPQYQHGGGFLYIIRDIEKCMFKKGIPGQSVKEGHHEVPVGCLELDSLSMMDQLSTVRITDDIMRQVGYWNW